MMKNFLGILVTILISNNGIGQDYELEFRKCYNDTLREIQTLERWEKDKPEDPQLYIKYFSYYYHKSEKEVSALIREGFKLKDSLNQTAGYLKSHLYFDHSELQKGMDKMDRGIELHPNRLDMRTGKIFILGEVEAWERYTNEIIRTIKYSAINNNNWEWTNSIMNDYGQEFFLGQIQKFQNKLREAQDKSLHLNMQKIAKVNLKYYPDDVESLNTLALTYIWNDEFDKGLKPLLKAEKINPENPDVLLNLGYIYQQKGDKQKAIEYYKKSARYGDYITKYKAKVLIDKLTK